MWECNRPVMSSADICSKNDLASLESFVVSYNMGKHAIHHQRSSSIYCVAGEFGRELSLAYW